jgi:N4-gp56 family major capsid protein
MTAFNAGIVELKMFDEAGTLVNTTGGYTNAYNGNVENFSGANSLTAGMKTFYNTALLENARSTFIFQQLGRKQTLPQHHGMTVEWRKWNTLPDCDKLQEAVIPVGKKLGETAINVAIAEYGQYVAISKQMETHYVDDTVLGATEELGASAGRTYEKLIRNVLGANTNVIFADVINDGKYVSTPATRDALKTAMATEGNKPYLTPDMINKAVTVLRKNNAPYYSGNKFVAVIHPSCTYDLRSHPDWVEAHKYARPEEIYNGEIGELHGVRFVESDLAPIIKGDGDTYAVYQVMVFGRDAFGVVDPAGAGMEMIIKSAKEVGGPLEQFGTAGTKFSMAAKILYPERLLTLESLSSYSAVDEAN